MNFAPYSLSLRQLQYVIAVAEARNFRRAAELCHVSQPSLSTQISELENNLGIPIFERTPRQVLLTPAGEQLLVYAQNIVVETENFITMAKQLRDPLSGTLRIGVLPTIAPYFLPSAAPILRKKFPKLTILWVEDKTETILSALHSATLDAIVLAKTADVYDLKSMVLQKDLFVLATPKKHALGLKKSPVKLNELRGHDLLLLEEGHCFRDQALTVCEKAHAHELSFRATSLPTLTQMVASGVGVTLLPEMAVATENRHREFTIRSFDEPAPFRTILLAWRASSPLSKWFEAIGKSIKKDEPTT